MARPVISRNPFSPLVTLLRAVAHNGGVSLLRVHILLLLTLRYTLLEPLRLLQRAQYDRLLDAHPLQQDPIFVLGHWRSGTSYLQKLLGQDPRFATSTLFHSLFSDISLVSKPWLPPILDRLSRWLRVPFSIQRRAVLQMDIPAEGDVGLLCQMSPHSYTWGHIFPRNFPQWRDRLVTDPTPQQAQDWLDALDRFMRQIAAAHPGRRVVMKSPGDTARLSWLAQRYPDARFVYIHRDPIAVFHSNRYLWQVIRREYSLQTISDAAVDEIILETYPRLLARYLEQRDAVSADRLVEVQYADLRDRPVAEMERIYATLHLGDVPPALKDTLSTSPRYRQQTYTTPPPLEARIREAWAVGFTEWTSPP